MNRETEKIFYNQRIIIDNMVLTEPRTWHVTKINRIGNNGVALITLAQDLFNEQNDYIEKDADGNVIAMWADYYKSSITPVKPSEEQPETPDVHSEVTYAGTKAEIKVGGSYKKFTVKFFDSDNNEVEMQSGEWTYRFKDGTDATDLLNILTPNDSNDVLDNQIKIKFIGDDLYTNQILVIGYESELAVNSYVEVEIVGL